MLKPLRSALTKVDESERFRLLASLLVDLADQVRSGGDGRTTPEQVEALTRKLQALNEEKASLQDTLATTRADLDHRAKQTEAEQARAVKLQGVVDDQRTRLESLQKQNGDLEAQVVAKNTELHRAQNEVDNLQLKLQRAEQASAGRERIDSLERTSQETNAELNEARERMEELREAKDAEIEKLKDELRRSEAGSSQSADAMLAALWQRLAAAKPALAAGHVPPSSQSAERLVDAFIELVRFVTDLDESLGVFLAKYTKHHPSVKVPWDVYVKRDNVPKTVEQTIAPQGGRPVGVLKMRLRVLYSWVYAAMIANDSALESIAAELRGHLMGSVGTGSDPNQKVRDYIRNQNGPELFEEHMKKRRSENLAEAFGRGG